MRVYVPSRGRYGYKFIEGPQTPLRWCPHERLTYVVRDDEYERYRNRLPPQVEVVKCGAPPNLSQKRIWIAEFAKSRGEKLHAQCDDDVKVFIRAAADSTKLLEVTPASVEQMFTAMVLALADYPMVGISAREGNNYAGTGPAPLIKECTRSMRFYAWRTDDFLSIDAGRMPEMADFDTVLQFLRRGQKNAVLYYWAQHQPGTQTNGGCQAYRTHATHEAAARKLQALHPDFVTLRTKTNKGGGEFGTRTEVTVQWQKAFASSDHVNS